jgi:hypothetical protein
MGWSCVIISTVNQKQHTQELLSNVLPFINTLSFGLNNRTSKRQRLVNAFVSNPISASTFPAQAMELQVSSSRWHDHCKNIAKTFPMQAMVLQVSLSRRRDHCKNPQYDYFHVHRLWRCKFANHLRIDLDILGTQRERTTWPLVRLGNRYTISKPPPQ